MRTLSQVPRNSLACRSTKTCAGSTQPLRMVPAEIVERSDIQRLYGLDTAALREDPMGHSGLPISISIEKSLEQPFAAAAATESD